ncbi:ER membrane protein complex subunit 1-like [Artemia franciscana]|uniref:ER membrane protein complex subunit 1 n=1 Tax=Artemia franciscana TaxID=6661 RepID=A0AA88HFU3_ARTSF|nr:hypothetical protein QYM36_016307 [Artemia franciscana]
MLYFAICTFICILSPVSSLYEDQIGKSDWSLKFLGHIEHADFTTNGKIVAVGTAKNVFSLLDYKTGSHKIRHVLESGDKGQIIFLKLLENRAIIVSGTCNQFAVREFDAIKGFLIRERQYNTPSVSKDGCQWATNDDSLLSLNQQDNKQLHLTVISIEDDKKEDHTSVDVTETSRCCLSGTSVTCVEKNDGTVTVLSLDDFSVMETKSLLNLGFHENDFASITTEAVTGILNAAVFTGKKLVVFHEEGEMVLSVGRDNCVWGGTEAESTKFLLVACQEREDIQISLVDLKSGGKVMERRLVSKASPSHIFPWITKNANGEIVNCRYLLSLEDHSVYFGTVKGDVWWTREEGLASVVSAHMVDLPVSEREAAIEEEFDNSQDGILSRMGRRITSESYQIFLIFKEVLLGRKTTTIAGVEDRGLVRDKFGFHKMVVVATEANKLFGMDSLSGKIVWSRYLTDFEPVIKRIGDKTHNEYPMFVLRGSAHHPLSARVAIVGRDKNTGKAAVFSFNPITGVPYTEEAIQLASKVKMIQQLHNAVENTQFIKPLLLVDENNEFYIYPQLEEPVKLTKPLYLTVGQSEDCSVVGYKVFHTPNEGISATVAWSLNLCDSDMPSSEHLSALVQKRPEENVHSPGRPLADRNVLYKYLNPNLFAVVVEGKHPVHKSHVKVFLVDGVTGNIVYSTVHKRATGPVHIVHSENWLVYSFYNEKMRRTEVTSVELYEGKERSSELFFTSFDDVKPMVEVQAYIFPAAISAMIETITHLGLTNKHILVAVPSRGILEMPRSFLDPRRPTIHSNEPREGLIPYVPELPIPPEGIINYNKTLGPITGIRTDPADLESTCLVFVYGLDLFFTLVMPSKTFDVLKDDFDHWLISTVLLGLIASSIVTRRLAAKKALRQAWK